MKINFEVLKFKNFMSYGNKFTEYDFQNGIDLITGQNGIGKSSLISDALFYSLFGKPYRKTKLSTLVNDINQKELLTEITFTINDKHYRILRGMKPNVFEIYINDKLLPQEASIKDYQLNLEENILRTNEQSFRQLIILGANVQSTKPFLELPQSEKEEVFNSVINTSIFSSILEVIKTRTNANKTKRVELDYKIDILSSTYSTEQDNIEKLKINNTDYTQKFKDKILDLELEQQELKQELDKIDTVLDKTTLIKSRMESQQKILDDFVIEYENTKKLISFSESTLKHIKGLKETHSTCIGCEHLKEISGVNIDEENEILSKLEFALIDKANQEQDIEEVQGKIEKFKNQITKIKTFIVTKKNNEKRLQQVHNEIQELKNYKFTEIDESNLKRLYSEILTEKDALKEVLENLNNLNNLKNIMQDKSLKGTIIAKQLPILNKHINEYLEKFSASEFNMIIDNTFKERILTSRGEEKEFNQLSSGQKFRLTYSLIFAFLKFIEEKNAISTNIMICDEVLDSSLDAQGRDDLLNILYNEFSYKNIIIISHNKEIQQKEEIFKRIINIYKENNFSKIEGV